jgi:hypothetical protein
MTAKLCTRCYERNVNERGEFCDKCEAEVKKLTELFENEKPIKKSSGGQLKLK